MNSPATLNEWMKQDTIPQCRVQLSRCKPGVTYTQLLELLERVYPKVNYWDVIARHLNVEAPSEDEVKAMIEYMAKELSSESTSNRL